MNEIFTIGDFCFRLVCPEEVNVPENFLKFRGRTEPVYTYALELSASFPIPAGSLMARREDLLVLQQDGLECRYIAVKGQSEPYACYQETGADSALIQLDPIRMNRINIDPVFVSLLALEKRMLDRDGMVLHCAFVEYQGEAILFSAPSETGKTTQANLWEKYRCARTVNGDRCLLQKIHGRWHARGWPVCGSSGVCRNQDVPIRAVVMLSQAPEDRAERLATMKAFTQVYGQITVNRWDRTANLRAMELLEDLVTHVPVFHLACTMGQTAVEALENALRESR